MLICLRDYHDPGLGLICAAGDRLIGPTPELEVWLLRVSQDAFTVYQSPRGRNQDSRRSASQAHACRGGPNLS